MDRNSRPQAQLLDGPVGSSLVRLSLPMIVGILTFIGFNLIDTYFVGQIGRDELAALGFTFPVILFVGSLAMGVGIGVMALVSRSIGENSWDRAAQETTDSLILGFVLVLLLSILGFFTIDPVFRLLGANETTLPLVRQYMEIWYFAMVFVVIPMIGNNAIRATGDTKTPTYIMLGAVFINAVLDPILIFGWGPIPEMGLRGAALATAISRGLTMLLAMYILYYRERLITLKTSWAAFVSCSRAILFIGLPAASARMINPLGIGILTALLAGINPAAVAAYGVGTRIEALALAVVMALSSAIGPFIGQNLGANKFNRIRISYRLGFRFALASGVVVAGLLALIAVPIATVFSDDPEVQRFIVLFLYVVPASYAFRGMTLLANTSLNTLQRPYQAAVLSAGEILLFAVPIAYLLAPQMDAVGVFLAITIGYTLTGLLSYWINQREFNRIVQDNQSATNVHPGD